MTYEEAFAILARVHIAMNLFMQTHSGEQNLALRWVAAFKEPANADARAAYHGAREYLATYVNPDSEQLAADTESTSQLLGGVDIQIKAEALAKTARLARQVNPETR
jgi:hypothetical protein